MIILKNTLTNGFRIVSQVGAASSCDADLQVIIREIAVSGPPGSVVQLGDLAVMRVAAALSGTVPSILSRFARDCLQSKIPITAGCLSAFGSGRSNKLAPGL